MPWTDSPLSGPHQSQARTPQGPPATRPGRPRGRIARGCPGPRSRSPSSPFARSSTALRSRARPSFRDPSRLRKPNPRAVLLSEGPRGRGPGPAGPGYETATDEHVTFAPRNWASAKARRPAPSTFSSSSPSPRSIPVSPAGATYLGPGLLAQAMRDAEELALASAGQARLVAVRAHAGGPGSPHPLLGPTRSAPAGESSGARPPCDPRRSRWPGVSSLKRADFRPEDFHGLLPGSG